MIMEIMDSRIQAFKLCSAIPAFDACHGLVLEPWLFLCIRHFTIDIRWVSPLLVVRASHQVKVLWLMHDAHKGGEVELLIFLQVCLVKLRVLLVLLCAQGELIINQKLQRLVLILMGSYRRVQGVCHALSVIHFIIIT